MIKDPNIITIKRRRNAQFINADPTVKYPIPLDESQTLPSTPITIFYSSVIFVGFIISIYLLAIVIKDYNSALNIDSQIYPLLEKDVLISENITRLYTTLTEITQRLIIIEYNIDILQINITNLGERIDNISCIGIREINGLETKDLFIRSGLEEFITINNDNVTNIITINGTKFQILLNIQAGSLTLLENFVQSLNAALALLDSLTIKFINLTPPDINNNIELIGFCNASVTGRNPNEVVVDACAIQAQINARYLEIYAEFAIAIEKLAILNANITFINNQIIIIESIIANVSSSALFTVNNRLPDVNGTILLTSTDSNLNITGTTITNEGVRTINFINGTLSTKNFRILEGLAIEVVNNPTAGTITINNVNSKQCSITQEAVSLASAPIISFTPPSGAPPNFLLDTYFNPAFTVTFPFGCNNQSSGNFPVFSRGFDTTRILWYNTICKPIGKWILSFLAFSTVSVSYSNFPNLNLNFGLGQEGLSQIDVPLSTWAIILTQNFIPTSSTFLTATYAFPFEPSACFNVTWSTYNGVLVDLDYFYSRWIFTQLN
jgi:hypothetical protein